MLHDKRVLQIEDFGAGSRTIKENTRTVATIAKSSLKPPKYSQLLFRIVDHYQPKNILELGTSLGLTTAYLAAAKSDAKVITMEFFRPNHAISIINKAIIELGNSQATDKNTSKNSLILASSSMFIFLRIVGRMNMFP